MPDIRCTYCGHTFQVTPEQAPQYAGRMINCPKCRKAFTVPSTAAPPASPSAGPAPAGDVVTAYTEATPPSYPGQPQSVRADQLKPLPKTKTSGWTLASLACGTIGWVVPVIPSLLGLAFGYLAWKNAPRGGGKQPVVVIGWTVLGLLFSTLVVAPRAYRAYEIANRVQCAGRIGRIGQAIAKYASNNEGQFPPDLQILLARTPPLITVDDLICPGSKDTPGSSSYTYAGKGFSKIAGQENYATPQTILLYEKPSHHNQDGCNFLCGNGQVVWEGIRFASYVIREVQAGHNPPRPWHGQE